MTPEIIRSPEEMAAAAAGFAAKAKPGDVFALVGDLGAGKTNWAKGFIQAIDSEAEVSSPTFSIVNEYRAGKLPVFHFDFYRMKSQGELLDLGWDEYLDENGILICEWANLFPDLIPKQALWLKITHQPGSTRKLEVISMGESRGT